MTVLEGLLATLRERRIHLTLLDPDKQPPEHAGAMAAAAERAGSDGIMIGGSTGYTREDLDATAMAVRGACSLPTILFPTSSGLLTPHTDAIFFMSMLNSVSCDYLIREHAKAAPVIRALGVEPISMGYLIVEPGMRVGEVGSAECVPRDRADLAMGYALAAEMLGMSLVYLEAGSGAPEPVPPEMVARVKEVLTIPLVVGGGIRSSGQAAAAVEAGADVVVTGTMVERADEANNVEGALRAIVRAVRGGP